MKERLYEDGHVVEDAWAAESSAVIGNAVLAGKSCAFGDVVLEGGCRGGIISIGGKLKIKGNGLRFETKEELTLHLKSEFEKRKHIKEVGGE